MKIDELQDRGVGDICSDLTTRGHEADLEQPRLRDRLHPDPGTNPSRGLPHLGGLPLLIDPPRLGGLLLVGGLLLPGLETWTTLLLGARRLR